MDRPELHQRLHLRHFFCAAPLSLPIKINAAAACVMDGGLGEAANKKEPPFAAAPSLSNREESTSGGEPLSPAICAGLRHFVSKHLTLR
jgi:hypothetical protein